MTIYTLLAADLSPVLASHQIVRIEHELLAKPLFVMAYFAPDLVNKNEAKAWAASLNLGGHSWRLPGAEEGTFIPNRAIWPCFDPKVFIGARSDYPVIWTDTPDPEEPASYSYVVGLGYGSVGRGRRDGRYHALAVLAGQ